LPDIFHSKHKHNSRFFLHICTDMYKQLTDRRWSAKELLWTCL